MLGGAGKEQRTHSNDLLANTLCNWIYYIEVQVFVVRDYSCKLRVHCELTNLRM